MERRCFKLELKGETLLLRLTVAGQMEMKREFHEETAETILNAAFDSGKMSSLLNEALSWKGNSNSIHDGAELYDRLVDEGWSGHAPFGCLAIDIAEASGIFSTKQAQQLKDILTQAENDVSAQMEEGGEDA